MPAARARWMRCSSSVSGSRAWPLSRSRPRGVGETVVMRSQPASDRGTPVSGVLLERDVELDLLAELLRDVDARRGRSLLFEAAAGLRKSALLEHAVSAGGEAGLVVLRARGHQLERGFAWGVARSLFEASLWGS